MSFEYKCVGAPERPKRQRGVRGRSERVALAMQEIIEAEAVDGWEYLRTDLVPVEEKAGLFSRTQEVHRAVLIFRRELAPEPRFVAPGRLRAAERETVSENAAQVAQVDRGAEAHDSRIPLAADRDAPLPARGSRDEPSSPAPTNRPPSGLG